jgi:hypothetical protein
MTTSTLSEYQKDLVTIKIKNVYRERGEDRVCFFDYIARRSNISDRYQWVCFDILTSPDYPSSYGDWDAIEDYLIRKTEADETYMELIKKLWNDYNESVNFYYTGGENIKI